MSPSEIISVSNIILHLSVVSGPCPGLYDGPRREDLVKNQYALIVNKGLVLGGSTHTP